MRDQLGVRLARIQAHHPYYLAEKVTTCFRVPAFIDQEFVGHWCTEMDGEAHARARCDQTGYNQRTARRSQPEGSVGHGK